MPEKTFPPLIVISLGIALLIAGLFFDGATAGSSRTQAELTPTPDRLAEPTLPAAPSQADHGAQVYWLSCMPCHGDRGQGLTDEFRATYPPEEEYCWESGCHGANPYESGFSLPKEIPAVVGRTSLAKFADAAQLHAYIRATMPYWDPGSLSEEQSWRVTAYLLRQNELWNASAELNPANAADVKIPRAAFLTPVTTPAPAGEATPGGAGFWLILGGTAVLLLLVLFALKKSRNTTTI